MSVFPSLLHLYPQYLSLLFFFSLEKKEKEKRNVETAGINGKGQDVGRPPFYNGRVNNMLVY